MTESRSMEARGGPDLFSAVGRHLALFLLPIVVLAGAGVAYGYIRQPRYTAESRVSIGQLNLAIQGIPGFIAAANNLAAAYARTIGAPDVTQKAAQAAGVSAQRAYDDLSASAISDTPLFRIEATDRDKAVAVKLANAGANALILHVLDLNKRANLRGQILAKYNRAAQKVAQLERQAHIAAGGPSSVSIKARLSKAILRQNALGNLYEAAATGEASENLLQVVSPAAHPSGDRTTTIERGALIGGLVGLLLGLALAAGREASLQRRAI